MPWIIARKLYSGASLRKHLAHSHRSQNPDFPELKVSQVLGNDLDFFSSLTRNDSYRNHICDLKDS